MHRRHYLIASKPIQFCSHEIIYENIKLRVVTHKNEMFIEKYDYKISAKKIFY